VTPPERLFSKKVALIVQDIFLQRNELSCSLLRNILGQALFMLCDKQAGSNRS